MASSTSTSSPSRFEPLDELSANYSEVFKFLRAELTAAIPETASDDIYDDLFLYRFYRGHGLNTKAALEALKLAAKTRLDEDLNSIRSKSAVGQQMFPHGGKIAQHFPHSISHKHDRFGQPLSVERLGLVNPTRFLGSVSLPEFLAYHYYHTEYKSKLIAELSQETNKVIRLAKITDLSGLGNQHLSRGCLKYLKSIAEFSQANYPEALGDWYIVNAPTLFSFAWSLIRPLLSDSTVSKVHILGADFLPELEKNIPIENIPKFLGGKCECEGGCVRVVDPFEGLKQIEIPARGKKEILIPFNEEAKQYFIKANQQVKDEGKNEISDENYDNNDMNLVFELEYEFRTRSNDIVFELQFFNESNNSSAIIRAAKKYQSDAELANEIIKIEPNMGKIKINNKNNNNNSIINENSNENYYTSIKIIFDNSYSIFTSKNVFYRISQSISSRIIDNQGDQPQPSVEEIPSSNEINRTDGISNEEELKIKNHNELIRNELRNC